jgi:hypothetical protein
MILPEHCSVKVDGVECPYPPSFIVSVTTGENSYMISVVCLEHRDKVQKRIAMMQQKREIPAGAIEFQPIQIVGTDCIAGSSEDYVEVELNRGIESDRPI